MKKLNKKGFTLIEMLVVIAIIAILVSIIVPVVGNSTTKAAAATNAANLRSVAAEVAIKHLEDPVAIPAGTYTASGGTLDLNGAATLKAPVSKSVKGVIDGDQEMIVYITGEDVIATYKGTETNTNGKDLTVDNFADVAEDGKLDSTTPLDTPPATGNGPTLDGDPTLTLCNCENSVNVINAEDGLCDNCSHEVHEGKCTAEGTGSTETANHVCADANTDHVCDNGCTEVQGGACALDNGAHYCEYCGETQGDHTYTKVSDHRHACACGDEGNHSVSRYTSEGHMCVCGHKVKGHYDGKDGGSTCDTTGCGYTKVEKTCECTVGADKPSQFAQRPPCSSCTHTHRKNVTCGAGTGEFEWVKN